MHGNPLLSSVNFDNLTLHELRQVARALAEVVETQLTPFADPATDRRKEPRVFPQVLMLAPGPVPVDPLQAVPHVALWVDTYNRLAHRVSDLTRQPVQPLPAEIAPDSLLTAMRVLLAALGDA